MSFETRHMLDALCSSDSAMDYVYSQPEPTFGGMGMDRGLYMSPMPEIFSLYEQNNPVPLPVWTESSFHGTRPREIIVQALADLAANNSASTNDQHATTASDGSDNATDKADSAPLCPSRDRPPPRKSCLKRRISPKRPARAVKLSFRQGEALASCIQTGVPVAANSIHSNARKRFLERRRELKALKASESVDSDDDTPLSAPETKNQKKYNKKLKQLVRLSSKALSDRLDAALSNSEIESQRALERGALDLALYVCKHKSKLQNRLSESIAMRYNQGTLLGSYEGPEKEHAVSGGAETVANSDWYYDLGTAVSASRTKVGFMRDRKYF